MIRLVLQSLLAVWGAVRLVGGWLNDRQQRLFGRMQADREQFNRAKKAQERMDKIEPSDSDTVRDRLRDGRF